MVLRAVSAAVRQEQRGKVPEGHMFPRRKVTP